MTAAAVGASPKRPNILFILADDHALQQISAYRPDNVVTTPQIDRIAAAGMRLDNCFCCNSLCAPSRASILTGNYNHICGVRTLQEKFDNRQRTIAHALREGGYQTAMIGKWHLGHEEANTPRGFDHWEILIGQGEYHNPRFLSEAGLAQETGYVTEIITAKCLDWLEERDVDRPFFLMCHHKAPHRDWQPAPQYVGRYADVDFPHPETYHDDYETRGPAAWRARMRIDDLTERDCKQPFPEDLSPEELVDWKYQRFMEDYMACVASIDDGVGQLLDYLEEHGLLEETLVIYSSDQGFYTGEHGWFDKRFMYEESHHMPCLVQYPGHIPAGSSSQEMILNIDFAPTWLDFAGLSAGALTTQGRSMRQVLEADEETGQGYDYIYYRYWDKTSDHHVYPHYGVRGRRYKLICFRNLEPGEGESPTYWELYDLKTDPNELNNRIDDPALAAVREDMHRALLQLQEKYQDTELL
ncbi:MAG: sulfatase [Bacillota bacterium]|nr:sulfatase [Bacillota bacterium]